MDKQPTPTGVSVAVPTRARREARPGRALWHGPLHVESWLLRAGMLGVLVGQVVLEHNRSGAVVAAEGLIASLIPLAVQRFSRVHVPRPMELVFVLAIALQFISESTKLFEHLYYWDKVVHPTMIALSAMLVVWMVLGYREASGRKVPVHLAAAIAILFGAALGAFWEFFEFTLDWFTNAGLQKSNGDTVTDMIANTLGAIAATLIGLWIYHRWLREPQMVEMGQVGRWLVHGPGELLSHHGRLVGSVAAAAFIAVVGGGVWIDRNPPALAAGLQPGATGQWSFARASLPGGSERTLLGGWQPDPRGLCSTNPNHPEPGAEKPSLVELAPAQAFGLGSQPFTISTRSFEERPPIIKGTQMDAGIAFGIRDPRDYYVLHESALHDVLELDRYVHGKKRDLREKLYRTHGNEWHDLQVAVSGSQVSASIDGKRIYTVSGLQDLSGGVGLWSLASSTSCFSTLSAEVGHGS